MTDESPRAGMTVQVGRTMQPGQFQQNPQASHMQIHGQQSQMNLQQASQIQPMQGQMQQMQGQGQMNQPNQMGVQLQQGLFFLSALTRFLHPMCFRTPYILVRVN